MDAITIGDSSPGYLSSVVSKPIRRFGEAAGGSNSFDGFKDDLDFVIMLAIFASQRFNLVRQVRMGRHDLAQFHEGPHDGNIDGNCSLTAENGRKHDYALFGECQRRIFGITATALV